MIEIKELKDQIAKFVRDGQERFDRIEKAGGKTDETLEAIKTQFADLSVELQKQADAIRAEEAERKALEALMARMPQKSRDGDGNIGDPTVRNEWKSYLARGDKRSQIAPETVTKGLHELAEHYGLSTDEQTITVLRAGLVGSNPDGGFLAPIDPLRVISRRIFETSPIRQLANVISTAREAVTVLIDDQEAGSGWVGEVDARPETDTPQVAEMEIATHEQYAEPKISTKALDDVSINLESWLQNKVASKFARTENTAFVLGDAIKKPRGILDYPAWATAGNYERYALEHRDTGTVGTIAGDDLIDLQSDLLEEYQANATWLMHRKMWAEIVQLKDSQNQYLINPVLLFAGVDMQLLGRPVRMAGDMPSAIAEGETVAVYGDFREGYTIVDRIGIRVLRDPYTDKRFVKFYTTKRVGGAVTNYQALKVLDVQAS